VREFSSAPVTLEQIGQLCWAASGITAREAGYDLRTAPSAGALYPLELYALTTEGLFRYVPRGHRLDLRRAGDFRPPLVRAALGQAAVAQAPVVFVFSAVTRRTTHKYGLRGAARYIPMEAGHAAQNLLLQATALGLGGVVMGAFDDRAVRAVLALPAGEHPVYLVPVGHPRP
jgi:SagB-type dehydrogenase family enzyme